jgi:hypothetical protein
MPKRSNFFQAVVHSIQAHLAGKANVEESALLLDRRTGSPREVDIAVTLTLGGHDLRLSIECCDRARPASVEWVEQLKAKHADLPTNKLVLVSRNGFSKAALKKATEYGIECQTLDLKGDISWSKVIAGLKLIFLQTMNLSTRVSVAPRLDAPISELTFLAPGSYLFQSTDVPSLDTQSAVDALLSKESILDTILDVAGTEAPGVRIDFELREGTSYGSGLRVGIADTLVVMFLIDRVSSPVELTHGKYGEHLVAYGRTKTELGELLVTMVEGEQHPASAKVSLHSATGDVQVVDIGSGILGTLRPASDDLMRLYVGTRPRTWP